MKQKLVKLLTPTEPTPPRLHRVQSSGAPWLGAAGLSGAACFSRGKDAERTAKTPAKAWRSFTASQNSISFNLTF